MASSAVNVVRTIAPFDRLSNNDYAARKYTLTTTARADPLPAEWAGKNIEIHVMGLTAATDVAVFGISKNPSATIDAAVAPADSGTATNVGKPLMNGSVATVRLPTKLASETLYLVRDATAVIGGNGTFMNVCLASD